MYYKNIQIMSTLSANPIIAKHQKRYDVGDMFIPRYGLKPLQILHKIDKIDCDNSNYIVKSSYDEGKTWRNENIVISFSTLNALIKNEHLTLTANQKDTQN